MKVAIIGSRKIESKEFIFSNIDKYKSEISAIISGGAVGVDSIAKSYAQSNNIQLLEYIPNYAKFGKAAPLIRNRQIIDSCEMVLAFWDTKSKGTKYAMDYAKKQNKRVICIISEI
jgi:predicted Rossmann fold nucleotide-binding protein DprA/Smf involved in DNA uptake